MTRDIRCPSSWTPEQKARFEVWVEGEETSDSDPRLDRNPALVLRDLSSTIAQDLGLELDEASFEEAIRLCEEPAPDGLFERVEAEIGRERFGQSALPRFNRYSIPAKVDPKAVDCPYCTKRPRNLPAHCRAAHPDKPEAR